MFSEHLEFNMSKMEQVTSCAPMKPTSLPSACPMSASSISIESAPKAPVACTFLAHFNMNSSSSFVDSTFKSHPSLLSTGTDTTGIQASLFLAWNHQELPNGVPTSTLIPLLAMYKSKLWYWRDGSVVMSRYCSCRGSMWGPFITSHNSRSMPLASTGTWFGCVSTHAHTCVWTHTQLNKLLRVNHFTSCLIPHLHFIAVKQVTSFIQSRHPRPPPLYSMNLPMYTHYLAQEVSVLFSSVTDFLYPCVSSSPGRPLPSA